MTEPILVIIYNWGDLTDSQKIELRDYLEHTLPRGSWSWRRFVEDEAEVDDVFTTYMEIEFIDPNAAIMCKLAWGGQ